MKPSAPSGTKYTYMMYLAAMNPCAMMNSYQEEEWRRILFALRHHLTSMHLASCKLQSVVRGYVAKQRMRMKLEEWKEAALGTSAARPHSMDQRFFAHMPVSYRHALLAALHPRGQAT